MELFDINYNGNLYRVYCVEDCGPNKGGLWCMVYKSLDNIPNNCYEDDYSDDFCVHKEDCDCTDYNAVKEEIYKYFNENYN